MVAAEDPRVEKDHGHQPGRHCHNLRDALNAPPSADDTAEEKNAVAFVYVPTFPSPPSQGGPRQVELQLRELMDGSPGLPVFTTRQNLLDQLGDDQPFEKVAVLELLVQFSRSDVQVVVDPTVRPGRAP